MINYSREVRNTIIITLGLATIFLIFLFHLIAPLTNLLSGYNNLVDYVNTTYNETRSHRSLVFFGESVQSIGLLIDIIIILVILFISLIVYLCVRWSFKYNK